MSKIRSVSDLWKEYCRINFGKDLPNISRIQLYESEKVFYGAIGKILLELRDEVSLLPEEIAVNHMENLINEVKTFWEIKIKEYGELK